MPSHARVDRTAGAGARRHPDDLMTCIPLRDYQLIPTAPTPPTCAHACIYPHTSPHIWPRGFGLLAQNSHPPGPAPPPAPCSSLRLTVLQLNLRFGAVAPLHMQDRHIVPMRHGCSSSQVYKTSQAQAHTTTGTGLRWASAEPCRPIRDHRKAACFSQPRRSEAAGRCGRPAGRSPARSVASD